MIKEKKRKITYNKIGCKMQRGNLVIVESGSKTKTIQKILGDEYVVIASGGHIDNLPKKKLGIDLDNDFQAHYTILPAKQAWVRDVRNRLAKGGQEIWLATDKDLEGERIAEAIRVQCRLSSFRRVYFTEITPVAIREAFANPLSHLDVAALESQETRRVLDRLIGYQLSPVLWKTFPQNSRTPLSIGRVQAATLSLVVERSRRQDSTASKKWSITGDFLSLPKTTYHGTKTLESRSEVNQLFSSLRGIFTAIAKAPTVVKVAPPPPFMTSTIQQTAYRELSMPIKRTMKICQELYEKGYITYPRTDSCKLSVTFRTEAMAWLTERYGAEYIATESCHRQKMMASKAQEAHEAIRPTSCGREILPPEIGHDHGRLYALLWKRAMASLLRPAHYRETKIYIRDASFQEDCAFRCAPRALVFAGFHILSSGPSCPQCQEYSEIEWSVMCQGIEAREVFESLPPRYDEASLVRRMEEEGIGRPATYQQSIDKLVEKHYIEKRGSEGILEKIEILHWKDVLEPILVLEESIRVGAEPSNRFCFTELGLRVHDFLASHFPSIMSVAFTKEMELHLDEVQQGCKTRLTILRDFYRAWEPLLTSVLRMPSLVTVAPKAIPLREYKIGRRLYRVYEGRFGPYLKFKDGARIKNMSLMPYLAWKGLAGIEGLQSEDIALLASIPRTVEGGLVMEYGRYGFYCRTDKMLTPIQIRTLLLGEAQGNDQCQSESLFLRDG